MKTDFSLPTASPAADHASRTTHHGSPALPLAEFGERLVTLCDGRIGLRGGLHVDIREPGPPSIIHHPPNHQSINPSSSIQHPASSPAPPILDFIASDETLDRYDEILVAGGWRLEHYRRNPVFQNAHQYGDIIFTLGKALITEVRGGKLYQRVEFATEANPMARIAYALYKGKFLNAVSVGFIPIRWLNADGTEHSTHDRAPSSLSDACPDAVGAGGEGEGQEAASFCTLHSPLPTQNFRRKYLEQELLEVSAVGIPANPNALQLGLKAGAIAKADLQDLWDLLRSLCESDVRTGVLPVSIPDAAQPPASGPAREPDPFRSPMAVPNTNTSALGVRGNEAHWLQLARALRDILRAA